MYDVNDELQRLLQDDVDLPDLSYTTYDTLEQRLPHQVDTGFDDRPERHGHQVHDCVYWKMWLGEQLLLQFFCLFY
jgi:hypothetical protein